MVVVKVNRERGVEVQVAEITEGVQKLLVMLIGWGMLGTTPALAVRGER